MHTRETKDIQVLPIKQYTGSESVLQALYSQIKDLSYDAFLHNTILSFASAARFFGIILLKGQEADPASRDVEVEAKVLRWQLGEDVPANTPSNAGAPTTHLTQLPAIGLVYLMDHGPSYDFGTPGSGVANVGVIIDPLYRGRRYAYQAVTLTLAHAFERLALHRVQALVVDSPIKNNVIAFFTQMRFNREGTSRRSAYRPMDGVWKDVTYLAILDHAWKTKAVSRPAPKSMWDELYARHQSEREDLLKWENIPTIGSGTTTLKSARQEDMEKAKADILCAMMQDDDDDYYYDEDEGEDGEEYPDSDEDIKQKSKERMSAADLEELELERAIQMSIADTNSEVSFATGRAMVPSSATTGPALSSTSSWDIPSLDGNSLRM